MSPEEVVETKHALVGIAEILRSYFESLCEQGFSSGEALQIVIAYQAALVIGEAGSKPKDEE